MKKFTVSEVVTKLRERFASGNDVPVPDVRLTRAEFDVIADLLEAREIARNDAIEREYERENNPATSDAERLAEALSRLVDEWAYIADEGDATLEDSAIGYRACAIRLAALLAAHSAQAQPPAASVTDAMVGRAQDCLHDKGKDIGYYHMRAALEAALAAQENPNGL